MPLKYDCTLRKLLKVKEQMLIIYQVCQPNFFKKKSYIKIQLVIKFDKILGIY